MIYSKNTAPAVIVVQASRESDVRERRARINARTMHIKKPRLAQRDVKNHDLAGDRVTRAKDAEEERHEDTVYAWLSLDEAASYEDDAQLKTEDADEEDEKEEERSTGMSTASVNKLQVLWDYFIHAEPQSYEVQSNLHFASLRGHA